jgi:L-2-hydroxyglutarate oxidase
MRHDVVVIGGGLVGLAVAYALGRRRPEATVVVLEQEAAVAQHQSGHTSGVLHAGLSYAPGSLKARLARAGLRAMSAFCRMYRLPHERCGKLVVATTPGELARLERLLARGRRNGLVGLRRLGAAELREIEPHAAGLGALHAPEEGIVDFSAVARMLARCIEAAGGSVHTNAKVVGLRRPVAGSGWVVETTAGEVEADALVNSAGLESDRIARMAGERPPARIVPFRGDYYRLRPGREHLVRHLLYPVPDPAFPFLGAHFTRQVRGGVLAGPSAALALARDGAGRRRFRSSDAASALGYPGLWRFVVHHAATCGAELARSASVHRFAAALARLVPEIEPADLLHAGAGVRAQAMRPTGDLVDDFLIVEGPSSVHVINAPSPAATASLAIGGEIVGLLAAQLGWPLEPEQRVEQHA